VYLSLVHKRATQDASSPPAATAISNGSNNDKGKDESPTGATVPDSVLRAALLRRAAESLSRLIEVRMAKGAIAGLQARGSVGDDLSQRLLRAEKEIDLELRDVVNEVGSSVNDQD